MRIKVQQTAAGAAICFDASRGGESASLDAAGLRKLIAELQVCIPVASVTKAARSVARKIKGAK